MNTSRPAHGLSADYWNGLSERARAMYGVIRPLPRSTYTVDIRLGGLERFLESIDGDMRSMGGGLELVPDFQRGHKWDPIQKRSYVESFLRNQAPKNILFNCRNWMQMGEAQDGDIAEHTLQCVDGLQRLTAVREFLAGQFTVFEAWTCEDLNGTPFDTKGYTLSVSVFDFSWRSELLLFYLDLNSGGTVHEAEELDRVRALQQSAESERAK